MELEDSGAPAPRGQRVQHVRLRLRPTLRPETRREYRSPSEDSPSPTYRPAPGRRQSPVVQRWLPVDRDMRDDSPDRVVTHTRRHEDDFDEREERAVVRRQPRAFAAGASRRAGPSPPGGGSLSDRFAPLS
eukprot:NODE_1120_length_669_cov_539.080645_g877_i0.p1 GENE.NODE_1120_length_669_cov_539.080645_g877_i0~~NODE_1120_length_669_cov_539.080645_g877_i0.p1  ORF type:complete len:131 (+),score=12.15 NODE_1120_length_669_cov_539.080645_g877_i0:227-619(+)